MSTQVEKKRRGGGRNGKVQVMFSGQWIQNDLGKAVAKAVRGTYFTVLTNLSNVLVVAFRSASPVTWLIQTFCRLRSSTPNTTLITAAAAAIVLCSQVFVLFLSAEGKKRKLDLPARPPFTNVKRSSVEIELLTRMEFKLCLHLNTSPLIACTTARFNIFLIIFVPSFLPSRKNRQMLLFVFRVLFCLSRNVGN